MTNNNQQFTITTRPANVSPDERRRRLYQAYQILLDAAEKQQRQAANDGTGNGKETAVKGCQ